jgi:hypothetical protein
MLFCPLPTIWKKNIMEGRVKSDITSINIERDICQRLLVFSDGAVCGVFSGGIIVQLHSDAQEATVIDTSISGAIISQRTSLILSKYKR